MPKVIFKPGFSVEYTEPNTPCANLGNWKRHGQDYKLPVLRYKKLSSRPWQEDCFKKLLDKRLWIVTAPMASGKTLLICALAYKKLCRNKDLRVIISVPQTIIADGFASDKFELPSGEHVNWTVSTRNDLCSANRDPVSNSTIQHTLHWLKRPASFEMEDRVLLCAHATLAEAYGKEPGAFKNVLVIIDEAHHALCMDNHSLCIQNRLGALITHAAINGIELGLTTATFFRSDAADIVPAKYLSMFERYRLGFPEFLENIRPFGHFSYDFILYAASWLPMLKRLFRQRVGKTIVYVPAVNSGSSIGKHCEVALVLKAIAGKDKPVIKDADKPVMRVQRGGSWVKVVNLVEEANRGAKKEALFRAHRSGKAGAVDVIIALNMFREGANWEWADREIIIGPRNSIVDLLQTIGRLFRRPKNRTKPRASVIHLLSRGLATVGEENQKAEIRTKLNDYLKAIFASMLLEQLFTPPAALRAQVPKIGQPERDPKPALTELLGTICEPEVLLTSIFSSLLDWQQRHGTKDCKRLKAELDILVSAALKPYGLAGVAAEVSALVWSACAKRTAQLRGISAAQMDVELLRDSPLDFVLAYTSGLYGIKDLHDLRTQLRNAFMSFEEARAYARASGIKNSREWREHVRALKQKPEAL
jgi:superfamily II DNA or RNA helicase